MKLHNATEKIKDKGAADCPIFYDYLMAITVCVTENSTVVKVMFFDRRNRPTHQSHGVQRWNERYFEPPEKVIWEFEKINNIKIDRIDTSRYEGKRLRGELLVLLKEKTGLKYTEIGNYHVFADLSFASLRSIYRNKKKKKQKI